MNGTNKITEQEAIKAREKWIMGFNDTMLRIWQEKITLLGVDDTEQRYLLLPDAKHRVIERHYILLSGIYCLLLCYPIRSIHRG